ncbi:MAG: ArsR family transcriptional regulator [bacterium]
MFASVPSGSSLEFLSTSRQTLLVAIKTMGEATTEQLAKETFLSPGAVRQHLLALEAQGLVTYVRLREGPGRPRHVFRLTSHGEDLFPQQYALMANELLRALQAEDGGLFERILGRLVDAQVELAKNRIHATSRTERILEMVKFIEQYGYFPSLEVLDNGPVRLTLHHCPLLNVAKNHPGVCEIECASLKAVMMTDSVTRVAHRLAGDAVCTYLVE